MLYLSPYRTKPFILHTSFCVSNIVVIIWFRAIPLTVCTILLFLTKPFINMSLLGDIIDWFICFIENITKYIIVCFTHFDNTYLILIHHHVLKWLNYINKQYFFRTFIYIWVFSSQRLHTLVQCIVLHDRCSHNCLFWSSPSIWEINKRLSIHLCWAPMARWTCIKNLEFILAPLNLEIIWNKLWISFKFVKPIKINVGSRQISFNLIHCSVINHFYENFRYLLRMQLKPKQMLKWIREVTKKPNLGMTKWQQFSKKYSWKCTFDPLITLEIL